MSQKANYFKIGLFVISAVGLFLAGIIILSVGILSKQSLIMETYLDGSVQGLDVGSPIKLRGVKIGQVEDILLADAIYATEHHYVIIRFSIHPHIAKHINMTSFVPNLKKEIQTGLRLRLATQGLTGVGYIEADYMDPARYPPLPIDWKPEYAYVPSAPSLISRVSDSADTILRQIERARIDMLASNINVFVTTMTGLMQEDLKPTLIAVQQASKETANMVARLDKDLQHITQSDLPPLFQNAHQSSSNLVVMSEQINQMLQQVGGMLESGQQQWDETLENIQATSSEFRELVRNAQQYPSGILFGKPPPRVEIEQ